MEINLFFKSEISFRSKNRGLVFDWNCFNKNLIHITDCYYDYYHETVLKLVCIGSLFSPVSMLLYVMSGSAYCAMMMIILNVRALVNCTLYTVYIRNACHQVNAFI